MTSRDAWTAHIRPEDYERHMASMAQPQANGDLLAELFRGHPPPDGSPILFPGAGTGQVFDYFPVGQLAPYEITFTDINPEFLERLRERIAGHASACPRVCVDDIEAPSVRGPFDLAIVILVLEHVDWRRAVAGLCAIAARVVTIIQQDPAEVRQRPLPGSMAVLGEVASGLIDRDALAAAFADRGFELARESFRDVPDGKRMLALDFTRRR